MTKKQAAAKRRVAWDDALRDGRVVRNGDGISFTSFCTAAQASAAVAAQTAAGLIASIVVVGFLPPRIGDQGQENGNDQQDRT
jgi:hypothetical protein